MSTTTLPGVSPDYRHVTKSIAPGETLEIRRFATLKWYDIALRTRPFPRRSASSHGSASPTR